MIVALRRSRHEVTESFIDGSLIKGATKEAKEAKEEQLSGVSKKGDGRWHDSAEPRVRYTEHKIRRQASDPLSALMLLGEQVDNATPQ